MDDGTALARRESNAGRQPMPAPVVAAKSPLRCRQMSEGDIKAAVDLLSRGFAERERAYWMRAMAVLRERQVPDGYPRFGYVLEAGGGLVGILLMIFTARAKEGRSNGQADDSQLDKSRDDDGQGDGEAVFCNLSSWYVDSAYRGYADLLMKTALRRYGDAIFVNISAAPHTRPIIEANGFSRYADGAFFAVPSLASPVQGLHLRHDASPAIAPDGCIGLTCELEGERHSFLFLRRRILRDRIAAAQLVSCADMRQFVRFAGPLGRFLLRRGMPVVMLDANGPVAGLAGRYCPDRTPKYFRGPKAPRLGDLADTELILFGP